LNEKLLRLPFYTIVAGIIIEATDYITAFTLIKSQAEWTLQMETIAFCVQVVISSILFVLIGRKLRKTYDRTSWFKSVSLLVTYSIIALALEQLLQHFGSYRLINIIMYIPIDIFNVITYALVRISSANSANWMYAIPALFAPYLFLIFRRNDLNDN